jgi:hypothetical protein
MATPPKAYLLVGGVLHWLLLGFLATLPALVTGRLVFGAVQATSPGKRFTAAFWAMFAGALWLWLVVSSPLGPLLYQAGLPLAAGVGVASGAYAVVWFHRALRYGTWKIFLWLSAAAAAGAVVVGVLLTVSAQDRCVDGVIARGDWRTLQAVTVAGVPRDLSRTLERAAPIRYVNLPKLRGDVAVVNRNSRSLLGVVWTPAESRGARGAGAAGSEWEQLACYKFALDPKDERVRVAAACLQSYESQPTRTTPAQSKSGLGPVVDAIGAPLEALIDWHQGNLNLSWVGIPPGGELATTNAEPVYLVRAGSSLRLLICGREVRDHPLALIWYDTSQYGPWEEALTVAVTATPRRLDPAALLLPAGAWVAGGLLAAGLLFEFLQAPAAAWCAAARRRWQGRGLRRAHARVEKLMAHNRPEHELKLELVKLSNDFQLLRGEGKSRPWLLHWLETQKEAHKANASARKAQALEALCRQLAATIEAYDHGAEVEARHKRLPQRLEQQAWAEAAVWETERAKHEAEALGHEAQKLEAQVRIEQLRRQLAAKPEVPAEKPKPKTLQEELADAYHEHQTLLAQGLPPTEAEKFYKERQREIIARHRLRGS